MDVNKYIGKVKAEHIAVIGIILLLAGIFTLFIGNQNSRQNDERARSNLRSFRSVLQAGVIANNGLYHKEQTMLCKDTSACMKYFPDLKISGKDQVCLFLASNAIKKLCVCHDDGSVSGFCMENGLSVPKSMCYC